MKKFVVLFVISLGLIFYSCEKYEFYDDATSEKTHETRIRIKNSGGTKSTSAILETSDTIPLNSAVIFFAEVVFGNPYIFNWDFGNGDTTSGQQVVYKYQQTGTYTVTLESYDGQTWSTSTLDVIVIDGYYFYPVFELYETGLITPEGKISYTFKFLKNAVPEPVSGNGPFFYTGSNPESNWEEVLVSSSDDTWCYYSYDSYNVVNSQAFGGMYNGNAIWGDMESSMYYDTGYNHIRAGLYNGTLITESDWSQFIPGETGDEGDNPPIRITVTSDSITFFADVRNYTNGGVNWPKFKYKLSEIGEWSTPKETSFIGGSGYVKHSMARSAEDKYFFNFFKDWTDLSEPIYYNTSIFYNQEGYLYFEVLGMDNN